MTDNYYMPDYFLYFFTILLKMNQNSYEST